MVAKYVEQSGTPSYPGTTTPFVTLWDIDFTKVAPGVWPADATVLTRNGRDMIARNRTSAAAAMLIDGTGLVITTNNVAGIYGAGATELTAPYVDIAFSDVDFNVGPLRTRVSYDCTGAVADFQFFYASWMWNGFGIWNALLVGHNSGASPTTPVHLGSTIQTNSSGGVLNTTNVPETGIGSSDMRMTDFNLFNGRFSPLQRRADGAWPVFPDAPELWFEALTRNQVRAGPSTIIKDSNPSGVLAPLHLQLVAQNAGTTPWTLRVKSVQVDQYQVFQP